MPATPKPYTTRLRRRIRAATLPPAGLVMAGFAAAIAAGTLLLLLPWASRGGTSPVDALFTATSAVCVTGLVVVDTGSHFTLLGQGIILGLIQLGGLGMMTISVLVFIAFGQSISIRYRLALQDLFAPSPSGEILRLTTAILRFTLLAEAAGAALLFLRFRETAPVGEALWQAIFHSVSAFCNAGFALWPESLAGFAGEPLVVLTAAGLIVAGGIGFPVLYELYSLTRRRPQGTRPFRLSLHSKAVLLTTGVLLAGGTLLFALLEGDTFGEQTLLGAFFQSVTCRTAGFSTVEMNTLGSPSLAVTLFLMLIGASPGSCGGGIKTTTLFTLAALAWSRVRGQTSASAFHRTLPRKTVGRSLALPVLAGAVTALGFFLLLAADGGDHGLFLPYLFESVSAFATVGLSMGATPEFGAVGKMVLVVLMYIGRVGVLTFSYMIAGEASARYSYAEENVMIG